MPLCPHCDKAIDKGTVTCPQCGQNTQPDAAMLATMSAPAVNKLVKGFTRNLAEDPDDQKSSGYLAMCFLRLKLYDKAMPHFEKALDMNYEDAEAYFMAAICLLRGKKPFLAQRADINKAVEYLNAANQIEEKAIYYQLLGYIKQDYFDRKFLNVSPTTEEEYAKADELGLTDDDVQTLTTLLGL